MDKNILHRAVKKHFRINRWDNLPYLTSMKRGQKRTHDRQVLGNLLADLGLNVGVEIGVRKGYSAQFWCEANPKIKLTCIDPWLPRKRWDDANQEAFYIEAQDRLSPYNVEIIRAKSMDIVDKFVDESLDFVHIDGNHEFDYCCPDIIFWSRKIKKGGVILVHDYCPFHWNGVMKAVEAYTYCHHIDPWYCTRSKTPTVFWMKL